MGPPAALHPAFWIGEHMNDNCAVTIADHAHCWHWWGSSGGHGKSQRSGADAVGIGVFPMPTLERACTVAQLGVLLQAPQPIALA